jgi:hypothetical protein
MDGIDSFVFYFVTQAINRVEFDLVKDRDRIEQ